METLKLGASIAVREPQVLLDPTLRPGKYRVTLVVVTDRGESEPAELRLVVREARTPVTPVTPVGPRDVRPIRPIDVVPRRPSGAVAPGATAKPARAKAAPKPKSKPKPKPKPKGK